MSNQDADKDTDYELLLCRALDDERAENHLTVRKYATEFTMRGFEVDESKLGKWCGAVNRPSLNTWMLLGEAWKANPLYFFIKAGIFQREVPLERVIDDDRRLDAMGKESVQDALVTQLKGTERRKAQREQRGDAGA
jgi:hypothetical protein